MRREALTAARLSRGVYLCAGCSGQFGRKDIAVDHVIPVTAPEGITSWDGFIERLFCPASGLSVLCKPCHKAKTKTENKARVRRTA
jgi:5-methylcytosine-specific restriction endonuclease McrA